MKTKPFRERKGIAKSGFFGGELSEAGSAAFNFIYDICKEHNIKKEDFFHIETRCVSLAGVNINDDTHGHWSDNEIVQLLDEKGEVLAMAYINRNDMNCAEVIMVDLFND